VVSSLAYPTCLGIKGLVVIVVVDRKGRRESDSYPALEGGGGGAVGPSLSSATWQWDACHTLVVCGRAVGVDCRPTFKIDSEFKSSSNRFEFEQ
jgi:hypothetical protein